LLKDTRGQNPGPFVRASSAPVDCWFLDAMTFDEFGPGSLGPGVSLLTVCLYRSTTLSDCLSVSLYPCLCLSLYLPVCLYVSLSLGGFGWGDS